VVSFANSIGDLIGGLNPYVALPPGWVDETDPNPGGVQAHFRNPTRCGPLQMSWLERTGVRQPRRTAFPECVNPIWRARIRMRCGHRKGRRPMCTLFNGTAKFSLPPDRCFGRCGSSPAVPGFLSSPLYMSARVPGQLKPRKLMTPFVAYTLVEPP